jgi:hypothetical protein
MNDSAYVEEILERARVQGLAQETIDALTSVLASPGMSTDVAIAANHTRPHDFIVVMLDGTFHYVTVKCDEQGDPVESAFLHALLTGSEYVHGWPACEQHLVDYMITSGMEHAIDQMLDRNDDEQGDGQ